MTIIRKIALLIAMVYFASAGIVSAHTDVNSDITTSTTRTKANSPYHLRKQIYVTPGASLTIEKGVVVASYKPDQGSLAVTRGAKIYTKGERNEPVIMTSAEDVATWTGTTNVVRDGNAAADLCPQ